MWTAITLAVSKIFTSWTDKKVAENKAEAEYKTTLAKGEQDWDIVALKASQHSWKDEVIMVIWFFPLVMAWFDPDRAMKWVDFVGELPMWYQVGMFGIIAASFGLRWYFKQQNFKIKPSK